MAREYTTWPKVLSLYPTAADIESVGAEQTKLIQAKSDEFHSYIRARHKADLESTGDVDKPYDELVMKCVANLVIEDLRQRRISDDSELELATFPHITGKFTNQGLQAHGIIAGIIAGKIVLAQDHAEVDVNAPEAVVVTKVGPGRIQVLLPTRYDSLTVDVHRIRITTAGRADAATARFTHWVNENAVSVTTDCIVDGGAYHLGANLYAKFSDVAPTADSFNTGDEWMITAVPDTVQRQAGGPRQIEFLRG